MNRFFSENAVGRKFVFPAIGLATYLALVYFLKMPCPIYFFTGISCPGCGMTRALFSLLRLDFAMALHYHPLIFFCIVAIPGWAVLHMKKKTRAKKILAAIFVVVFFAAYLYRLLILKSPILHFTPENGLFARLLAFCLH